MLSGEGNETGAPNDGFLLAQKKCILSGAIN